MKPIAAPRFGRALIVQLGVLLAIGVAFAIVNALDERKEPIVEKKVEPPKEEERVVIVKVEKIDPPKIDPPKPREELAVKTPPPREQPKHEPPREQPKHEPPREQPKPQPPREQPQPQREAPSVRPAPSPVVAEIADVGGVPLRVLVPSSPDELEHYLRRSASCLLVSRMAGDRAEVIAAYELTGGRAQPSARPPCQGVPRVIRDRALIAALGDPIALTRAQYAAGGELIMQIVLPPALLAQADRAARRRLGDAPDKELARRAAAASYEIRCYAKTDGTLACI